MGHVRCTVKAFCGVCRKKINDVFEKRGCDRETRGKTCGKASLRQRLHVRSAHGEIDIIAENSEYLVFAEVKTRADNPVHFANYGRPAEAVNKQKQRHIIYTAGIFLQNHPTEKAVRFDVIEVYLGETIQFNHIEDAFRL